MITDLAALEKKARIKKDECVDVCARVYVFGISNASQDTSHWPRGASAYLKGIRGTWSQSVHVWFCFSLAESLSRAETHTLHSQNHRLMTFVAGHTLTANFQMIKGRFLVTLCRKKSPLCIFIVFIHTQLPPPSVYPSLLSSSPPSLGVCGNPAHCSADE